MSIFIAGTGWVTPLGDSVSEVWQRLLRGEEAGAETISDSISEKTYPVFRVPADGLQNLPRHPRLRRASAISRFAAAAGLAALENARSTIGDIDMNRTALIFGAANGGVIYTKRFYHDIAVTGAQSASPLLFPETVFNAPASHLAAILGIDGASYTVVADGSVGILALKMAEDLLASEAFDYCLVVAAEESDWLLCDAYSKWRLLRRAPSIEPFRSPPKGTILSEGAGAVVVARRGPVEIEKIHAGGYYASRREAGKLLSQIIRETGTAEIGAIFASANGTFVDKLEVDSTTTALPKATMYTLKPALGESVGASALWNVIAGIEALDSAQLPPLLHAPPHLSKAAGSSFESVLILSCGLSQQAAGLRLRKSGA